MNWRFFALAFAILSETALADATLVYDASTPRTIPGNGAAYYYNPGVDDAGQSGHILFDDVTVPSSWPVTIFQVTQVTVAVSRLANAPSVQITPYYAQFFPNTVSSGGPNDGPYSDPLYPRTFGNPITLATNGGAYVDGATITFGNGTSSLFNVVGFPAGPTSGYRSFALGLNFSTTDKQNGWTLAGQTNNLDVDWDYLSNSNFAEFTFGSDSSGPITATQYIQVEGSVVQGISADANFDGKVDIGDARILAQHWNQPGDYTMGDFNFDGIVNVADLSILAANWPSSSMALSNALAVNGLPNVLVPEPTQLTLLIFAALAAFRRR